MPDMLVKLYELPELEPALKKLKASGIEIRRPLAPEKHIVTDWVKKHFDEKWASECDVSFSNRPVSCFIAVKGEKILGFACHDATCRNYFGPMGVDKKERGRGTGKALLLACMHAMKQYGYAYAVIGGAGPVEFYAKTVGAVAIENSAPGIYRGMLKG
jgi:GNAT superfamily N-acetyltransferase